MRLVEYTEAATDMQLALSAAMHPFALCFLVSCWTSRRAAGYGGMQKPSVAPRLSVLSSCCTELQSMLCHSA